MKQNLITAGFLAVSLLSGCSIEQDLAVSGNADGKTIAFSASQVSSLRATVTTTATLADFKVSGWGKTLSNVVYPGNVVLDSVTVRKTAGHWLYSPEKRWPVQSRIDFFAYSPAGSPLVTSGGFAMAAGDTSSVTHTPVIEYDVPGYVGAAGAAALADIKTQEDFLVAHQLGLTNAVIDPEVRLNFQHALARLKLNARTTVPGLTILVTGVTFKNLKHKGTLDLSDFKSTDPEKGKFEYTNDGIKYTTLWNADSETVDYKIDLSASPIQLTAGGGYKDLLPTNQGLMVLPQETTLGKFRDSTSLEERDSRPGDAVTDTVPGAFYMLIDYREQYTDGYTSPVKTRVIRVKDAYDPNNRGVVFEAGREYRYSLQLGSGLTACPGTTMTDPRDGKTYSIAAFGGMCWMTENLAYKPALPADGGEAVEAVTYARGVFGSYKQFFVAPTASVAMNLPADSTTARVHDTKYNGGGMGYLYSGAAAMNITATQAQTNIGAGVRGICPPGWHLPTDAEWTALEKVIALDAAQTYSTTGGTSTWNDNFGTVTGWRGDHGTKMKSTAPITATNPAGTSKAATANGFNALLVGNARDGSMYDWGTAACFWSSSTGGNNAYALYRILNDSNAGVNRSSYHKAYSHSVRCVQ